MKREQELDGEMGGQLPSTPSWSCFRSLSLFLSLSLSVNEGWERGGAWVTSVSGCVTFLRREGVGGVVQRVVEKNTDACQQPPSRGAIMPCFRPGGQRPCVAPRKRERGRGKWQKKKNRQKGER